MPGPLRIGELAARTGRSVHTIRWYETQRLIPGVTRDSSGRRVYHELHVGWLDLLQRLRRTGMSIRQMREYTVLAGQGGKTLAARRDLLSAHRQTVQAMIEDLNDSLRLIDAKIDFYGKWLVTGTRPRLPSAVPAPRRKTPASRTATAAPRARPATPLPAVAAARVRSSTRRPPAPRAKRG